MSLAQISSGAIRCSFNTRFRTRFWRVLVQIPREVPEGSGANTPWGSGGFRWRYLLRLRRVLCGSGGFRCRYLVRLQRVPVRIPAEVLEVSGAGIRWGSGGLRCRYLVRFYGVLVQVPGEVPEVSGAATWWGSGGSRWRCVVRFRRVPGQIPCEVPEGSGAETLWGPGGFWRRRCSVRLWGSGGFRGRYLVRFRRVLVQRPCEVPEGFGGEDARWGCEVPEGSGAETLWGSGGFWRRRCSVRFCRFLVQIPCEVPEGSGAESLKWQSVKCIWGVLKQINRRLQIFEVWSTKLLNLWWTPWMQMIRAGMVHHASSSRISNMRLPLVHNWCEECLWSKQPHRAAAVLRAFHA